jgi:TrmH RNA methyltransferase
MSTKQEQVVYGVQACLALHARRPGDIVRIFHSPGRAKQLAPLLRWAASRRVVYRQLDAEGMARAAGSPHHEGVVIVARPLTFRAMQPRDAEAASTWVLLDNVSNPHNLGAILRTCGFFGVEAVIAGGVEPGSKVNAAAQRVSQGGAEAVRLFAAPMLPKAAGWLRRAGVTLIGLESDAPAALEAVPMPWPCALVLGHEQTGLSPAIRQRCDRLAAIRGRGGVGSLNVSVAAGLAIAAMLRGAGR